jgi:hypothetical protein
MKNFLIATEQHVRLFSSYLKRNSNSVIYIPEVSPRKNAINYELNFYNLNNIQKKNSKYFISDILKKNEWFITPLHLGNTYHQFYKECEGIEHFLQTKNINIPSKIGFMSEHLYFNKKKFIPYVDKIFARSKTEADMWRKTNENVFLIGDLSLDNCLPDVKHYNSPKALGLFTALDNFREFNIELVHSTIKQISNWIENGINLEKLVLKQHPGDKTEKFIESLKDLCKKNNIKFIKADRFSNIRDIQIDTAIVIGSFSTHVHLITSGIDSRFYFTSNKNDQNEWENEFFSLSDIPLFSPENKYSNDNKYINWLKETFLLDGHTVQRFEEELI